MYGNSKEDAGNGVCRMRNDKALTNKASTHSWETMISKVLLPQEEKAHCAALLLKDHSTTETKLQLSHHLFWHWDVMSTEFHGSGQEIAVLDCDWKNVKKISHLKNCVLNNHCFHIQATHDQSHKATQTASMSENVRKQGLMCELSSPPTTILKRCMCGNDDNSPLLGKR